MLGVCAKLELPTVLLIDDDMVSREVMATVLTLSGYTVHTADGGAAALEMLEAGQCTPFVILMDAQMPNLSGLQLIEQLRARSQASIYAISGSLATDDVIAAADGFLLKPFRPDDLQTLLEKHTPATTPPTPEPNLPIVSAVTLAQFRELMPEVMVREIYAAVSADLRKRIAALEAAIASCDSAEVRRIGHAIKGGCSMAGALQAAWLGAQLESGSDKLGDCAAVLRDLQAAAQDLKSILKAEFPTQ